MRLIRVITQLSKQSGAPSYSPLSFFPTMVINGTSKIRKWRYVSTIFSAIELGGIYPYIGLKNRPYRLGNFNKSVPEMAMEIWLTIEICYILGHIAIVNHFCSTMVTTFKVSGKSLYLTERRFCALAGLAPLDAQMDQLLVEAVQRKLSDLASENHGENRLM